MCNRSLYRRCWRRWLRRQTAPPLGRGRVARLSSRRRLRAGCRGRRRSDCRSAGTGSSRRSHSRRRRAPRARLRGWRRPQGRRRCLGPSRRPSRPDRRRASPRGSPAAMPVPKPAMKSPAATVKDGGLGCCRRCPNQQRRERRRDDFRQRWTRDVLLYSFGRVWDRRRPSEIQAIVQLPRTTGVDVPAPNGRDARYPRAAKPIMEK
jgi:hypothetical protein